MIPDLKDIFRQFGSIYHRSLMVLDNYHNINVPEPKTPVITRRLIPGKLTLSDIPKTSYYQYKVVFGWFPSTSQITNFTIYTRSSTIRMPAIRRKNFSQDEYQVFPHSVREAKLVSGIRVTSEVTVLESASNVEFSKAVNYHYRIYRLTRLHPSIITLLRNLTNMFYEGSRNENDKEQFRKIFRRNEEGLLLHGLKECNRVAVLLPRDT